MKTDIYDKDYFENGIVTAKSCYENYRWMPELTIAMAYNLIRHLDLHETDRVLDFGCAKGYLVRALRILHVQAFGCDVAKYAIANVDPDVREFCKLLSPKKERYLPFRGRFDWIMSKDVLEHLSDKAVDQFLREGRSATNKMFHVIPLGNNRGRYVIPEYEHDITHQPARTVAWWRERFQRHGWNEKAFSYQVRGVKENWTTSYSKGNGFFILERSELRRQ